MQYAEAGAHVALATQSYQPKVQPAESYFTHTCHNWPQVNKHQELERTAIPVLNICTFLDSRLYTARRCNLPFESPGLLVSALYKRR
jgi:hypothetical protein